ncbi:MAG: phage tail assembly protein [Lachnospiraceae bacterium]|nr:phage tail assembly protein [Lachnospiraceae bacterium]
MEYNKEEFVRDMAASFNTGERETSEEIENKEIIPEENQEETGSYIHKFKKPFEYEGKIYTEIEFDFERLTGKDMIAIDREIQANNEYVLAAELSKSFQCKMAAKAAKTKIGSDVIEAMPLFDFNKITNAARAFLLNTGY